LCVSGGFACGDDAHLVRGRLNVNGHTLSGGDALLVQHENQLAFDSGADAEVLVFDLAP